MKGPKKPKDPPGELSPREPNLAVPDQLEPGETYRDPEIASIKLVSESPPTILLDLDGVVANFIEGARQIFKPHTSYGDLIAYWLPEPGAYNCCPSLGLVHEDMLWEAVHALGPRFWTGLKPYEWARELYDGCVELVGVKNVHFLTSPSHASSSAQGKVEWLQAWLNNPDFRNYLIGPQKQLCARPTTLLVDDSDSHCEKFIRYGGDALVFPQVWNSRWKDRSPAQGKAVLSEIAAWVSENP